MSDRTAYHREYYQKNKAKRRAQHKAWAEANREKMRGYDRKWAEANPEKIKVKDRAKYLKDPERYRSYSKQYNKDHREELTTKANHKRHNNTQHRIAHNLRNRLRDAILGKYKTGSAVADLGCSIEEFMQHLENHFQAGMTWDNYGPYWHIDHIRPLCSFDLEDRDQFLQAAHWSNQQPLTAAENLSKGASFERRDT